MLAGYWLCSDLTVLDQANEFLFSHNGALMYTTLNGSIDISGVFPSREAVHTVTTSPVSTTALDLDPRGRCALKHAFIFLFTGLNSLLYRYLAAGSNDATVTLWETTDWTCVRSLGWHEYVKHSIFFLSFYGSSCSRAPSDPIRSVRFSHDGRYIASGSGERDIHVVRPPVPRPRAN